MSPKQFRKCLHEHKRVYGTLIVSESPRWPAVVAGIGVDFVFIDTEHVALDRGTLSFMCQCYGNLGISPIVRITSPDPYEATCVLDGGAHGILAPYVESAEQVLQLVGATKFRPLRGEKLQSTLNGEPHPPALSEYLEKNNEGNTLMVNIESVPAVRNLDSILAVKGLDAVLVGPHDLSTSLGVPEQYDNPLFIETVDEIILKARANDISVGLICIFNDPGCEKQLRWAELGANVIIHSGDILAMERTLRGEIGELRARLDKAKSSASPIVNALNI